MPPEEKKERMEKNKLYRKAKKAGLTLKEYLKISESPEFSEKEKVKKSHIKGGKKLRMNSYYKVILNELLSSMPSSQENIKDPIVVNRNTDELKILFKKENIALISYLKIPPALKQYPYPMFFVDINTGKQIPFNKKEDYCPTENKKNAEAVNWEKASSLLG